MLPGMTGPSYEERIGAVGDFSDKVFKTVQAIPQGKVASYGQIASMVGAPRSARYVGYALRGNHDLKTMPCHRVVFKDGRICEGYLFGGPEVQRKMLAGEGVAFIDDAHVDMEACIWKPEKEFRGRPSDIDWSKEID